VAPIPGEFTGFIGGYIFGIGPGFIYSTIGLTADSLFAFLISRRLGLPFVRRFVGQEIMGKFDYLMEHKGAFFFFRLFPHSRHAERLFLLPPGVEPLARAHFLCHLYSRKNSGNAPLDDARPGDSFRKLPSLLRRPWPGFPFLGHHLNLPGPDRGLVETPKKILALRPSLIEPKKFPRSQIC